MTKRHLLAFAGSTLASCALAAATGAAATTYTLHDLGPLYSVGTGISDAGQITGTAFVPQGNGYSSKNAFILGVSGGVDIGTLGGSASESYAIGRSGSVTGWSTPSGDPAEHAFLYSGGVMKDLGSLPGRQNSFGYSVNSLGEVVGVSGDGYYDTGPSRAFLYDGSALIDLGTLGGATSAAYGINDFGTVVGAADTGNTHTPDPHAFIYNGAMTDLGTLGGSSSWASAINDEGRVVGSSLIAGDSVSHAFFYAPGQPLVDLGDIGGEGSYAEAINGFNVITGFSQDASGAFVAWVDSGGVMSDLNTLVDAPAGWFLSMGTGVDDAGDIGGIGLLNGVDEGFILTPNAAVPEPATWALMIVGVGLAGASLRRKRVARATGLEPTTFGLGS